MTSIILTAWVQRNVYTQGVGERIEGPEEPPRHCIWTTYHHYRIMEFRLRIVGSSWIPTRTIPLSTLVRLFITAIQFLSVVALTIVPALHLPRLLLVLLAGFLLRQQSIGVFPSTALLNFYIPSRPIRRFLKHQLTHSPMLTGVPKSMEFFRVEKMICAGKTSSQIAHIGRDLCPRTLIPISNLQC